MVTDGPDDVRSGEQGDHRDPDPDGGRGGADLEGAAAVLLARLLGGDLGLGSAGGAVCASANFCAAVMPERRRTSVSFRPSASDAYTSFGEFDR